jgi:hypothetical protein
LVVPARADPRWLLHRKKVIAMLVLPGSLLTYDGKRIYSLPQTHDPDGTCYFGPPVKPKAVKAEQAGKCIVINFPSSRIVRKPESPEAA